MTITKRKRKPGGGRKATGKNTVTISFSVHKDYKEIIRALVFDKVKELKEGVKSATEINNSINKSMPMIKENTAVNYKGKMESDYLKQRRAAKSSKK